MKFFFFHVPETSSTSIAKSEGAGERRRRLRVPPPAPAGSPGAGAAARPLDFVGQLHVSSIFFHVAKSREQLLSEKGCNLV